MPSLKSAVAQYKKKIFSLSNCNLVGYDNYCLEGCRIFPDHIIILTFRKNKNVDKDTENNITDMYLPLFLSDS